MDFGVGGWHSCWSVTATTYPRPAERNLWAPRPESRSWMLLAASVKLARDLGKLLGLYSRWRALTSPRRPTVRDARDSLPDVAMNRASSPKDSAALPTRRPSIDFGLTRRVRSRTRCRGPSQTDTVTRAVVAADS